MHKPSFRVQLLLSCVCLILAGCGSLTAPKYTFSPESVQTLKDAGTSKLRIGEFQANTPEVETADIGMRGANFTSPYGSFANYLREAIRQEFAEAGRLSPAATIELGGVLVKNLFNTNGTSIGEGELTARITVLRDGLVVFDKSITATTTWESSFAGAVAIPKATIEYPRLVRKFVRTLLQDPDFIDSTK